MPFLKTPIFVVPLPFPVANDWDITGHTEGNCGITGIPFIISVCIKVPHAVSEDTDLRCSATIPVANDWDITGNLVGSRGLAFSSRKAGATDDQGWGRWITTGRDR